MKRLVFIITVLLGLSACKENAPEPHQEESVTLSIDISSESKAVSGATVTLYASKEDAINKLNSTSFKTTDANGEAEFKLPKGKTYYWLAEKGCKSNILTLEYSKAETTGKYVSGHAILEEISTVRITNTSMKTYKVEVDRGAFYSYEFTIEAGKTKIIENFLSGNHTLKYAELHQNMTWDGQSRSFTSVCGGTTTVNIL